MRSRSKPWWGGGFREHISGAWMTCAEFFEQTSVDLDSLEHAGFLSTEGSVLVADPRAQPWAPPGDWLTCIHCLEAFDPKYRFAAGMFCVGCIEQIGRDNARTEMQWALEGWQRTDGATQRLGAQLHRLAFGFDSALAESETVVTTYDRERGVVTVSRPAMPRGTVVPFPPAKLPLEPTRKGKPAFIPTPRLDGRR